MLIYEFSESGEGQLNKMLDFNAILFQSVEKISSYFQNFRIFRTFISLTNVTYALQVKRKILKIQTQLFHIF